MSNYPEIIQRIKLTSQIECEDIYVWTAFEAVNPDMDNKMTDFSYAQELPVSMNIGNAVYTFFDFLSYWNGYQYGDGCYAYSLWIGKR